VAKAAPASEGAPATSRLDATSRAWLEHLQASHPRHHQTVAGLHLVLLKMAMRELGRRRHLLPAVTGPELEDLAQQAADDALLNVLDRLQDFRGLSRFTTWVYRFVMFEVSAKVARHAWRRYPPGLGEPVWDDFPDPVRASRPEDALERRAQLEALREAIGALSERQRRVFVSVALNEIPIDVLALELGSNRNAVYKNLFDARQTLRARLAAAGHPVGETSEAAGCAAAQSARAAGAAL
jgi:RNA polymerase sigma-70 factor, ECF subfamily